MDMIDTNNIDELIKNIDSKIEKLEEKELAGKSLDEQQVLKDKWENEKSINENKLSEQQEKFDSKMSKWNDKQNELMPIEDVKKGIEDMMRKLDLEWEEAVNKFINELYKDKSLEEKEKFIKAFNNELD